MKHLTRYSVMAALSLSLFVAAMPTIAEARTLVRTEGYQGSICRLYFDDGSTDLSWCPLDWPTSLTVACNCEHITPFSDICEVWVKETDFALYYSYRAVGAARVDQPDPYSNFAWFSCPYGTPPGASTCTMKVTVTAPSGATGTSLCYSH